MYRPVILIADNDEIYLQTACEFFEKKNFQVLSASTPLQARNILEKDTVALAILDYRLGNDGDDKDKSGLRLAQETAYLNTPKIILTRFISYESAVESLRPDNGRVAAIDFVVKQEGLEKLLDAVNRALTKTKVFLCYANPDGDIVSGLYKKLAASGYYPWMDKKHIMGGEKWEIAIRKAIRSSDFFLVCLTKNSVNRRGFMQKEIKIAFDLWEEKLDDDIFMIPVKLEECKITHEKLLEVQWVELYKPEGFPRLIKAIEEGTKRRFSSGA